MENLGKSMFSDFNLDCSKREATYEYNEIVLPDTLTSYEASIHSFLDSLNIKQVAIKETMQA
jgi:hypothetical protein